MPPPPARPRGYFYEPVGAGERGAFELRVPARNGKPEGVISYGRMATAATNTVDVAVDNTRVVDCGVFGSVVRRPKRPRRPDGTRGPAEVANVSTGWERQRPEMDAEMSAESDIRRAIAKDVRLALAPKCNVHLSLTGAVVVTSDYGRPVKYASIADAAWALARREIR